MKYLAYMNILFGDNHVQNSLNWEKGGMPWNTILVLKIWLKQILSINYHHKMLQ
jgi:prepilin-type processing-associated H-X9-DG protein